MDAHFSKILQEAGLAKLESHIYLSLLSSPRQTISQIARNIGAKRPTCYQYIEFLLQKDFIVRVPQGKRMRYSATNPRKLLAALKKRQDNLETAFQYMAQQYDESTHKPKVSFYEGKREIRNIYEDIFKTIGDELSIFPPAPFFEHFTEQDFSDYDLAISQHAFKGKDLVVPDAFYKNVLKIRRKNSTEKGMKKLPENFKSNVDVLIYNEKVALISLRDLSALVIESKDIAELFKSMHAMMWKAS